ncbi:MAG TPA: GNAT family N-acetyltransferase [Paenalcaligenes sp.]|nr:GNAT family N-acetyltransferase [Paenalcaligenes sp.]
MSAFRHRLAAFFEPRSLVVIADREMPHVLSDDSPLVGRYAFFHFEKRRPWGLPATLPFMRAGQRLDLVVLSVDTMHLPALLERIAIWQPRALLLLASAKPSAHNKALMQQLKDWARAHRCYVMGPDSFGIQRPSLGLNASLNPTLATKAKVALLSQSRSLSAAVLDWADDVSMGFSCLMSLGDEADISLVDVLGYFAVDPYTDSIAVIADDTVSARKFSSALYAAAAVKPVVILPVASIEANASPAQNAVFDTLVRRVGAVRIHYFVQLFSALKVLVHARRPKGAGLALLSNGEGAAGLATEVIRRANTAYLATLKPQTLDALAAFSAEGDRVANPVVRYRPITAEYVRDSVLALNADENVAGILVLLAPDPLADFEAITQELIELTARLRKPIISCLIGERSMRPLRYRLDVAGAPAFRTPDTAANAFDLLAAHHESQIVAQQVLPPEPLGVAPDVDAARALLQQLIAQQRTQLDAAEVGQLFSYFAIPIHVLNDTAFAEKQQEAELSPLSIRVRRDPKVGPYFSVSPGGADGGAVTNYRNLELPPLNRVLANQLLQRCPGWASLYQKQVTPVVLELLKDTLEHVSEMISELPELESLSIDPLIADSHQLYAGAVDISLVPTHINESVQASGYAHLAIHPYPRHLVQEQQLRDETPWLMRPIRPEDAYALQEFIRDLSLETRYMRFVSMMRELTPQMLARYTRIDYDRELALVATVWHPNPEDRGRLYEKVVGFAHYLRNRDGLGAEYALVIADDWQRRGLGTTLMQGLITAARHQRLHYIDGYVLAKNQPMLKLMRSLGFTVERDELDPALRRVWLKLRDEPIDH